jgi:DNA-directed RNA polymerase subunit H (RpoH/RPB5)
MSYESIKNINVTTNQEWNIYNVILEFIKFRGLTLKSEPTTDSKKFVSEFNFLKYITIQAEDENKQAYTIVFVDNNTNYVTHSAQFMSLMSKIKNENKVIIISYVEKVSNIINALIKKNEWDKRLFLYPYRMFLTVFPLVKRYPKHTIISQEKLSLDYIQDNPKDHTRIALNDTMAVWLGAKIGDVIAIDRTNQATGESQGYRVVINKTIQD